VLPPEYPFAGDPFALTFVGENGQIVVQASGANSADVMTELFLYPLKFAAQSVRLQDYASAGFVQFTPDAPEAVLERPAGWYGVASRFVDTETGLATYRVRVEPVLAA
jgi:hypothetical protein